MPSWPGEVPAIHVGLQGTDIPVAGSFRKARLPGIGVCCDDHVDGRDKPGHDVRRREARIARAYSSDLTAAAIASGEGSTLSSSGGL